MYKESTGVIEMKKIYYWCTWIPSLKSLHQARSVNTRQENNSQRHSFQNSEEARDQSKKNVVEEKEVRHDGKQPPANKPTKNKK